MTYEQELELKIAKYTEPLHVADYITSEDLELLKSKVRDFFLESRLELLDIRVVAKVHDALDECHIGVHYCQTSLKIVEAEGKFTAHVDIDPDDPDPQTTLNFIAGELKLLHPNVEVRVVEQD